MPFLSSVEGTLGYGRGPTGGSSDSILGFARLLFSQYQGKLVPPTFGGTLAINGASMGEYEFTVAAANTVVSSFNPATWFSNLKDTVSSWIIVKGNFTINAGQTFTPPVRKLFTVVYVKGNLTLNGSISMTARGANHSGIGDSGGATQPVPIRLANGTYSGVTDPEIPTKGGAGGATRSTPGFNSGAALLGGTGGGGTGQVYISGTSPQGGSGTCFSGGSGSGGAYNGISEGGGEYGGAGGNGASTGGAIRAAGGAGNLGGIGSGIPPTNGPDGTGGVLIVIVEGSILGSGTFQANGASVTTQPYLGARGGASGGGVVTVFYNTDTSSTTVSAAGGLGQSSGSGGSGTARKLKL